MSILSEILQEEYNRLIATISSYEKLVADLPKGSIVPKKIKGKKYQYLQWREEDKIKSRYIKVDEMEEIATLISRRRNFEMELKKMYKSKREFDKIIGKEI